MRSGTNWARSDRNKLSWNQTTCQEIQEKISHVSTPFSEKRTRDLYRVRGRKRERESSHYSHTSCGVWDDSQIPVNSDLIYTSRSHSVPDHGIGIFHPDLEILQHSHPNPIPSRISGSEFFIPIPKIFQNSHPIPSHPIPPKFSGSGFSH